MRIMKKMFLLIVLSLVFGFSFVAMSKNVSAVPAEFPMYEAEVGNEEGKARFRTTSIVEANSLFAGIEHVKYIAECSTPFSGFNAAGSGGGGATVADQYYAQSVNVLTIPSTKDVKIVNWTYTSSTMSDEWVKATIVDMAKNFEANNPGWVVIAGVNGDFFDINGEGSYGNLLYQTRGATVQNGEVIRPISYSKNEVIGFKNDGSSNPVVYGEEFTVSEFPYLTIYNENGEEVAEFEVKHLNEEPAAGEIAVYYNYAYEPNTFTVTTTLPNSYFAQLSKRMLGMDEKHIYAKGTVKYTEETKTLTNDQFALYTENESIQKLLDTAYEVRVQYKVTGAYADCESVTAGNVTLNANGEGLYSTDKNRHPRTMIGYREDGTCVFVTVDGRQPDGNMYGMTNMEMSATMEAFGCYAATNMDGGGSTTMIIRENNAFRVLNSPSDGNERRDSNAVLVVMPALKLSVENVSDTTIELSVPKFGNDVQVSNIKATVDGGKTYFEAADGKLVISGLEASTGYTIEYTYDITVDGSTSSRVGDPFKVGTGLIKPIVKVVDWKWDGANYHIELDVQDPDGTLQLIWIKAKKNHYFKADTGYVLDIPSTEKLELELVYKYNLKAVYSDTETVNIKIGDHIICPECGRCIADDCPIETDKCLGHEPAKGGGCSFGFINTYLVLVPLCVIVLIGKKN